jgi:hypothetical protein
VPYPKLWIGGAVKTERRQVLSRPRFGFLIFNN